MLTGKLDKGSLTILTSHVGQRAGPPDAISEKDHSMTILSKFGSN
jgi:hypothetical protein